MAGYAGGPPLGGTTVPDSKPTKTFFRYSFSVFDQ